MPMQTPVLEHEMRAVLLALALTSNGRTAAYDPHGGGEPDHTLVDDRGRGKLGPGDAPHLRYAQAWERAAGELAQRTVLREARDELDHIRRSHADRDAGETLTQLKARIIASGEGFQARDVANALRVGIAIVHKARTEKGRDAQWGMPLVEGRKMTRGERDAEILRRSGQGANPHQISVAMSIPRSTVRDVLTAARAAAAT